MAQKVATARKMKSRQETTFLRQFATVTAKPTISDKHFTNTDMRRFKIQTGDMGPPPGRASLYHTPPHSFRGKDHLCMTTQRAPALETTKKDNPLHVCPYSASEPVEMGVREEKKYYRKNN